MNIARVSRINHGDPVELGVPGAIHLADEGGDVVMAESGADGEGHSDRG